MLHENEISDKEFFSKCQEIRRKLQIWLPVLKKSSTVEFILFSVSKFHRKKNQQFHWFFIIISLY